MKVESRRRVDWFWMNKSIIDTYGTQLGPYGIAVYCLLARCANEEGHAIPSLSYMARKLNMGRSSVQRALAVLEACQLIERKQRRTDAGDYASSTYILLPIDDEGIPPQNIGIPPQNTPVPPQNTPVPPQTIEYTPTEHTGIPPQTIRIPLQTTEQDPGNKIQWEQDPDPPPPPMGESPPIVQGVKERGMKTRMPQDLKRQEAMKAQIVDDQMRAWAAAKGIDLDLDTYWDEIFVNSCLQHGYRYADWRRTFQSWLVKEETHLANSRHPPRQSARMAHADCDVSRYENLGGPAYCNTCKVKLEAWEVPPKKQDSARARGVGGTG
jgi:Helix-turn-helix domain